MATKEAPKVSEEQVPVRKTSEEIVVEKAKEIVDKRGRTLLIAICVVAIAISGFFIYKNYFKAPEEKKATDAIWRAQEYYKIDSFRLALNGDATNLGFLRIASRYSGTKAGDLAKFYAGSCYLQMGDFANAVKYLKDFSTSQDELKVRATGLLGDAYSEQGKKQEAIEKYKEAGTIYEEDEASSSEYLFRAALLLQETGKTKEAIELLHTIKDKYPQTQRSFDSDKYLGKWGDTEAKADTK
jgi:tetratricopeptide (TPR) repeat protein